MAQQQAMKILVIGIGNLLMGDEGVGVHFIQHMEQRNDLPENMELLDGGTGGLTLVSDMEEAAWIIIVDATLDEKPEGSMEKLKPRYSKDYPRTLMAHDIGLKDLLDVFYISGKTPRVTLFTVTIKKESIKLGTKLTDKIESILPDLASRVLEEAGTIQQELMVVSE